MQAKSFIKLIRGNAGKNILFHCEHGHGRTSTFCVLARIADGWSLEAALKEEKNKFHYEFQHHAQEAFLRKHFSNFKG
jgi:protein tyrosine/serine phosphatase